MRLYAHVILDGGGRVTIEGKDLSGDDINEVFRILAGKQVESVDRYPTTGAEQFLQDLDNKKADQT